MKRHDLNPIIEWTPRSVDVEADELANGDNQSDKGWCILTKALEIGRLTEAGPSWSK